MKKSTRLIFWLATGLFGLLWWLVASRKPAVINTDQAIRAWVNAHQSTGLNHFFMAVTQLFDPLPVIITSVAVTAFCYVYYRRYAWQYAVTVISGTLLNKGIKHLVERPRPSHDLLMHYSGYSFPSGHSSGSALVLISLILIINVAALRPRTKQILNTICGLLVILIGVSRVYVGAHFPSDVLAGWCLGLIVVLFWDWCFDRFYHQKM